MKTTENTPTTFGPNPENENCLMDWFCPKCGNTDSFQVAITSWATLTDDGSDVDGDVEYEPDSRCRCTQCDYMATVADFDRYPYEAKEAE